ncbi:MAG: GH36-type glycosyl hydrolase domain-containing protein [Panacagrimonas sp.]
MRLNTPRAAALLAMGAGGAAAGTVATIFQAAVPDAAAVAGIAALLCAMLGGRLRQTWPTIPLVALCAAGFAAMAVPGMKPWQVPAAWPELLQLRPLSAAMLCTLYLALSLRGLLRPGKSMSAYGHLAMLVLPLLFNGLLALSSAGLMESLGAALGAEGTGAPSVSAALLGRILLLLGFNEVLLFGIGMLMDRRGAWRWQVHALLLGASALAAATPLVANLANHPSLAGLPWGLQALFAIPFAALSQSGLWAETFLATGLLLDALRGRRPTAEACLLHFRSGLTRGAIYAGLFMLVVILISGMMSIDALVRASRSAPPLACLLLGSLSFPLLKTLVESFDGSSPFHARMVAALRDPMNYVRGAVAGLGVGLAAAMNLPAAETLDRFLFGCGIGAAAYAGVDLLHDVIDLILRRRRGLQSIRVYGFGAVLGALVGGALTWYVDTAQLAAVIAKLGDYAAIGYDGAGRAVEPYVVYPLFSKWGAIDLGTVGGGVKLLYAESLSGVINWSLAAPLFSINLVVLTALFGKTWAPLRNLFSPSGLANLIEQAVRVLRWGLWMAPVIYSFLRLAPDPTWYNQDGAVRTIVATLQSLMLSPADFRAWSLSVFLGLLAYDALRMLIWFDHMGLRVATLVNLSFVGGDALDERAARFLGHSARTRVIPEGIRRFLTWAPLLIPFYIPRGQEWDLVWDQARAVGTAGQPLLPAVGTLLIGYRIVLALAVIGGVWLARRGWYSLVAVAPRTGSPPAPYRIGNGRYFMELAPDGRGYSRCDSELRPGFVLDLTRRPDDPMSLRGKFFYLRELDPAGAQIGPSWSLTHEPVRYGVCSVTQPTPTRLAIVRSQAGIRINARVEVAADEPVETWHLSVHNNTSRPRVIELTSYQELAVGPVDSYRRTPAFAGLHVGTVFVRSLGAILARNRLMRAASRDPSQARISREVGFHAVGGDATLIGFQDARSDFLGLGTARAPEARMEPLELEGLRYSFDPCASLRLRIDLPPGETRVLRFVDGYARDEQAAARRIAKHLGRLAPRAEDLRLLFEAPRKTVSSHDDEGLRDWSEPWSSDGTEVRAPTGARRPWTHVIANPLSHGAMVSSDGAMYAFAVNAQQNLLSPACLESLPAQQPGELFLVRDLDSGLTLGPALIPHRLPGAQRECVFAPGSARFQQRAADLEVALEVFADIDHPAQYRIMRVRNLGSTPRRLRVFACVEMVLAEAGQDSAGRLETDRVAPGAGSDVLLFRNPGNDFRRGWAFVASSLEQAESEGIRSRVFGPARDLTQPWLLVHGKADFSQADDGWRCATFCAGIELAPGATFESITVLGQTETREQSVQLAAQLREPASARQARARVREFWDERLGVLRVQTDNPGFDRLVNRWLPYQILVSRLWGRSGPAQRSGAFGFRDQLQDVLPLTLLDPALARRQILLHAAQQFREGDVLKWWHDSWQGRTGIGVRTRASDPHLWLPYVLARYLKATGDRGILDERIPFVEGRPVPAGHEGYLLAPRRSSDRATLYEHCCRAIDLSLKQRGARGLPLLGSGDWNDGLDAPGLKMRGESTWMAFFLHDVLGDFSAIADARKDAQVASRWRQEAARLRVAVEAMWRPGGYVRATSDEGSELLYADALTASWAVLSGSVDLDRGIAALESGLDTLEKPSRVLLMAPAFDEFSLPYPGRIAEYPPGVRENGGQYSHGSSWFVDAWLRCAQLAEEQGRTDTGRHCRRRAADLWFKISPLSKSTPTELPRYGLPPHQQAADVYDGPGYEGRGGWPWYTGAAARMLSAAYELMGLCEVDDTLHLDPRPGCPLVPRSVRFRGIAVAAPPAEPE